MSARSQPYRRLVAALFGTFKLTQMYGREHDATRDALRSLAGALADAKEDGAVRVGARGNRVQVNGRTMRSSECGALALSFLGREWRRRGLEAVRFQGDVPPEELGAFAAAFVELDTSRSDAAARLASACSTAGCRSISIERRDEIERDPVLLEERRESAMRAYLRGLRAFKLVLRCDGMKDRRNVRRARRAVQGLVDRFLEEESAVLALAQIRGHDPRLFQHCLNVCVYALLLGQRLGMTRRQLGELGLAALFHDLGKTIPVDGTQDTGQPARWEALHRHPSAGARMLLDEGTAHEGILKAAVVAYEHHVTYDRRGFPSLRFDPHLYSRIVAIADCYEALTSNSAYREDPYAPYDALALMQDKAGTLFDPLLLKVFVNALGIYPVGSLVELSTGEVALVIEAPGEHAPVDRPRVRIVLSAEGALEPDTTIDLAAAPDEGQTRPRILSTVARERVFADVGEFVSAI